MKHVSHAALIAIILLGTLSACQQTGGGPRSWIDQPLDKETFPFEVLMLQAHASDEDGVKDIEFLIDEQSITTINAGGGRMGKALYEWTPPGPGVYMIYAQAVDNNGNVGDAASSQITIGEQVAQVPLDEPDQPELKQSEEEEEEDPIQAAEEPVEGPHAVPSQAINCRSGPSTDYDVLTVLPADIPAEIVGRLSNNTWLFVSHPENYIECWVAASIVDVLGSSDEISIVSAPPPPPDQAEPPPAADTTAPAIYGAATDKQSMCASEKVTSNVVAHDDGGINKVYATWNITDGNGAEVESGYVEYTPIPSQENAYTGVFGVFNYSGTLSINGTVLDNADNSASFSHTITIDCS